MGNLQKNHNKEVRASGEYITQNRTWLVVIMILVIIIGIVASEVVTRGKISPYFDGGWLTYLIHEIVTRIREMLAKISEAVNAIKF
jgi:hypothetical protein